MPGNVHSAANPYVVVPANVIQKALQGGDAATAQTLAKEAQALQARTQADEFIIVTDIFDASARKRSLALTAEAWGLRAG